MAEGTESASVEATQEVASEAVSLINADGTFAENWKDSLPEDIRGEKSLDTFSDLPGAMKQLISAQKMIGKRDDRIALPGEGSTDVERDEFFKALGRPDTAGEYKMETSADIADHMDADMVVKAKEIFHDLGITQSQAKGLFAFEEARIAAGLEQQGQQAQQQYAEAETALKAKWGNAYEERLHLANRMIAENTTEETKEVVLNAVGNSPDVADFLANIATKFIEGGIIEGEGPKRLTPSEANVRIEELQNTPGYLTGELAKSSPAKYAQVTQELKEVFEAKNPE